MIDRLRRRLALWIYPANTQELIYSYAETSQIHEKNIAPKDKIYFIVRVYKGDVKYINWLLLQKQGFTSQYREQVYRKLIEDVIKKYGL